MFELATKPNFRDESKRLRADEMRAHEESLIDDIVAHQAVRNPDSIKNENDGIAAWLKLDDSIREPSVNGAYWMLEVKHRHGDSVLGKRQLVFHQYLTVDGKPQELSSMSYDYRETEDRIHRRGKDFSGQRIGGLADYHEELDLYLDLKMIMDSFELEPTESQTEEQLGSLALRAA